MVIKTAKFRDHTNYMTIIVIIYIISSSFSFNQRVNISATDIFWNIKEFRLLCLFLVLHFFNVFLPFLTFRKFLNDLYLFNHSLKHWLYNWLKSCLAFCRADLIFAVAIIIVDGWLNFLRLSLRLSCLRTPTEFILNKEFFWSSMRR